MYTYEDDTRFFAQKHYRATSAVIVDRITTKRRVIRKACNDMLAHGFTITVDYSKGDYGCRRSASLDEIMDAVCACDEEYLHVHDPRSDKPKRILGTIALVYGNDGWDVMSDYHVSLEPWLHAANEYAEWLSEYGV